MDAKPKKADDVKAEEEVRSPFVDFVFGSSRSSMPACGNAGIRFSAISLWMKYFCPEEGQKLAE